MYRRWAGRPRWGTQGGQGIRVLIIDQYFPPDTSATARIIGDVTDALSAAGHRVTVLCGRPSYDPTERRAWLPWRVERRGTVRIVRLGSTAFDRRWRPGRIANYLSFLGLATLATFLLRADVLLPMTDPPLCVVVAELARRGRRVVYNIRDLHPEFSIAAKLVEPGPLSRLWHRMHHWALARVESIVVLGDDVAARLLAKGIEASKISVVRDGAVIGGAPRPQDRDHPETHRIRNGFEFACVHAGNIGFGGAWSTLLDAATLLNGDGAGIVFVGDGWERKHIESDAPHNVAFHDFLPASDVRYVMAAGDLQIVTVRNGLEGIIVPSKLYSVLAAGRPVLAVVPEASDVARIVRESDAGVVCDPDDPVAVARAIRELRSDPVRRALMATNALRAAERFDRRICLDELVGAVVDGARPEGVHPGGGPERSVVAWASAKRPEGATALTSNGFWTGKSVCVTGGASFIGSHVVDALVEQGAKVRVVDDLSSGSLDNLAKSNGNVELIQGDLRRIAFAEKAVDGCSVVFHLAADHGGRGYIDLHQADVAANFALDQNVIRSAYELGCDKLVYASSGCVYPLHLQGDVDQELYLTEDMAGPPFAPDGIYGLAKISAEETLRAMHREHGFRSASLRYFTVYGPRGVENHAVMAMIGRAFTGQDPFEVWGTGEQIRNWTYVTDIARGTLLAAELVDDGRAINLGTSERIRVIDAVRRVCDLAGYEPTIKLIPDAPTGPVNRVASNDLARELLGWEPQVRFMNGVRTTYEWYEQNRDPEQARELLGRLLTERRRDELVIG